MSKAIVTDGSINGFLFDIVGKIQHDLDSDSTDHYVEDNTAVQDHIALKPEKITLVYYHGEVSDVSNNITSVEKKVNSKLLNQPVFINNVTQQTQQVKAQLAVLASEAVDSTSPPVPIPNNNKIINSNLNKKTPTNTKQIAAYNYFVKLRSNKTLVTCKTPYGIYSDMWLDKITPVQDEDTQIMSTFTIVLKQFRFANSVNVNYNANNYQGRVINQLAPNQTNRVNGLQVGTLPTLPPVPNIKITSTGTGLNSDIISNTFPAGITSQVIAGVKQ